MSPARKRRSELGRTTRVIKDALGNGAVRDQLTAVHWDCSGYCESPVSITCGGYKPTVLSDAQPNLRQAAWAPGDKNPMYLDMLVQCRQCPTCLRARARRWRGWIVDELRIAPRTWFGTLTVEPQWRAAYRLKALRGGGEFKNAADEFRSLHHQIGKDLTKFLKRVRKGNEDHPGPHRFRYVLVCEAHKDGFPHYHMMIHEVDPVAPVRKELLRGAWHQGFSVWKLVDDNEKAAWYAAKYLSKSNLARVRASLDYGCLAPGVENFSLEKFSTSNVLSTKLQEHCNVKIIDPPNENMK